MLCATKDAYDAGGTPCARPPEPDSFVAHMRGRCDNDPFGSENYQGGTREGSVELIPESFRNTFEEFATGLKGVEENESYLTLSEPRGFG